MQKITTFISFLVVSIFVAFVFFVLITATNYTQLAIGILLYFPLAYLAFQIFQRKGDDTPVIVSNVPETKTSGTIEDLPVAKKDISDTDKRAFLKFIGAAGVSFFVYSLLNRKGGVPLLGRSGESGPQTLLDTTGKKIDPAEKRPTDGYNISEIDDDIIAYYGFINKDGAWFIMREDTETNSFRYARGDSDFPANWSNRKDLGYEYFHNTF